jgi:hypothetical protein
MRRRKRWTVEHLVGTEIVKPMLARLEAGDDWVIAVVNVFAGVPARRTIAASDVSAGSTPAQVQPPAAGGEALDAAVPRRLCLRIDLSHGFSASLVGSNDPVAKIPPPTSSGTVGSFMCLTSISLAAPSAVHAVCSSSSRSRREYAAARSLRHAP